MRTVGEITSCYLCSDGPHVLLSESPVQHSRSTDCRCDRFLKGLGATLGTSAAPRFHLKLSTWPLSFPLYVIDLECIPGRNLHRSPESA